MKAMLACSTIPQWSDITYPVLASPKLDGIRCLAIDGVAYSRHMKLIPNEHIQHVFSELNLHGLDGELMIDGDFSSVQSAIMSTHGKPDFYFNVFDTFIDPKAMFTTRLQTATELVRAVPHNVVRLVPQRLINNEECLRHYLQECLDDGFEGLIIRAPKSPYKFGRSTLKQGWMLKLKVFDDTEAKVVGFKELMHNTDTSCRKQENMVPGGTLGALILDWNGVIFDLGSGFDMAQRDQIWYNRDEYLNKSVTFKYQGILTNSRPRFPVFKAFRDE